MSHLHMTLLRKRRGWPSLSLPRGKGDKTMLFVVLPMACGHCRPLQLSSFLVQEEEGRGHGQHPIFFPGIEIGMTLATWTRLPWPTSLFLIGRWKGMKDESPPLHPIEKERRMDMDQVAMANFPSPYRESEGREGGKATMASPIRLLRSRELWSWPHHIHLPEGRKG